MRSLRSVALCAEVLASAGCERTEAPRETAPSEIAQPTTAEKPAHPRLAPRAPRALHAARLPEDPVLAARTSAATDERRANKKHKRYLTFDGEYLPLHRTLLALIAMERARYDRARSASAVDAARTAMPARLAKLNEGLVTLDSKSVGSRLLADYEALYAALTSSYPEAKLASLRGDATALTTAQASFDERIKAMNTWLEEVEAAQAKDEAAKKLEGEQQAARR